jgi:hypothetical protein
MVMGWVDLSILEWVDAWDVYDEETFGRDDRHVLEVGIQIRRNRTSAHPNIEAEVVPS